jgi:hypothetical protein
MIKLHIEIFVEGCRKVFQWWLATLNLRVTDFAHRYRGSNKLGKMTVCATFVTGQIRRGGIVGYSGVTVCAAKRRMTLSRVIKLRIVSI